MLVIIYEKNRYTWLYSLQSGRGMLDAPTDGRTDGVKPPPPLKSL